MGYCWVVSLLSSEPSWEQHNSSSKRARDYRGIADLLDDFLHRTARAVQASIAAPTSSPTSIPAPSDTPTPLPTVSMPGVDSGSLNSRRLSVKDTPTLRKAGATPILRAAHERRKEDAGHMGQQVQCAEGYHV